MNYIKYLIFLLIFGIVSCSPKSKKITIENITIGDGTINTPYLVELENGTQFSFDISMSDDISSFSIHSLNSDNSIKNEQHNEISLAIDKSNKTLTITGSTPGTYNFQIIINQHSLYLNVTITTSILENYTITWKSEDEVLEVDSDVAKGTLPSFDGETPHKTPENDYSHYVFVGWSPKISSVQGDQTYHAVFDLVIVTYEITWQDADGSLLGTTVVEHGKLPTFDLPEDTETWKYTGWDKEITAALQSETYIAVREVQTEIDLPESLKVLAIGNSFTGDALYYFHQIAMSYGIEHVVTGNLIIGGASLELHASKLNDSNPTHTYQKVENGVWNQSTRNISYGILDEDWDYIILQQVSGKSGFINTYEPYLTELIDYVHLHKTNPNAEIGFHMVWAYPQHSKHKDFPLYNNSQLEMYDAITDTAQNHILTREDISFIIPTGTAIQNARSSYIGDTLNSDDHHLSVVHGRYLAGLMWFQHLTNAKLIYDIDRPYGIFEDDLIMMKESVLNAAKNPYTFTQSKYDVDPRSDQQFELNFYDFDQNLVHTSLVPFGQTIEPPALDDFDNYTFIGWNRTIPTKVSENLDFYAVYRKTSDDYSINYLFDDMNKMSTDIEDNHNIQIISKDMFEQETNALYDGDFLLKFNPRSGSIRITIEKDFTNLLDYDYILIRFFARGSENTTVYLLGKGQSRHNHITASKDGAWHTIKIHKSDMAGTINLWDRLFGSNPSTISSIDFVSTSPHAEIYLDYLGGGFDTLSVEQESQIDFEHILTNLLSSANNINIDSIYKDNTTIEIEHSNLVYTFNDTGLYHINLTVNNIPYQLEVNVLPKKQYEDPVEDFENQQNFNTIQNNHRLVSQSEFNNLYGTSTNYNIDGHALEFSASAGNTILTFNNDMSELLLYDYFTVNIFAIGTFSSRQPIYFNSVGASKWMNIDVVPLQNGTAFTWTVSKQDVSGDLNLWDRLFGSNPSTINRFELRIPAGMTVYLDELQGGFYNREMMLEETLDLNDTIKDTAFELEFVHLGDTIASNLDYTLSHGIFTPHTKGIFKLYIIVKKNGLAFGRFIIPVIVN